MSRKREFEDHDFDAQRFDAHEFEKFMPAAKDPSMQPEDQLSPEDSANGFGSGEIDALVWERLIDSQLPHDQYTELLRSMEARPELWRDCALAFLERQAWADAFNDLGWEVPAQPASNNDLSDQQLSALLSSGFGVDSQTDRSKTAEELQSSSSNNSIGTSKQNGPDLQNAKKESAAQSQGSSRNHWLKPVVFWIPTSVAAVFLVGVGLVELSKQPTVVPTEASPAIQLADMTFPSGEESMEQQVVEQFNQLPATQRQKIFSAAASYDVSATVPSSPAVFRQRKLDANRKFVFVEDAQGNWFVVPVDRFRSQPRDVQ